MKETPQQKTANSARKILRFLSSRKESFSPLLILTHDYPDPDTLASAFALSYLAEQGFGISCRIVYGGVIGRMENRGMVSILKIPAHKIKLSDFRKYSNVALLDTQPAFRNNSFPKNRRATLVIDQHPFVEKPDAECVIIDTECRATSVLLAQALLHSKLKIPANVATALAYGILSDTLNLYRAARPDIIQIYMSILSRSDIRALARIQNPYRSRRFFVTLREGIQNAMMRRRLVISHLGVVENPDLVSQVADFLLTYKGTLRSLCTGRYKEKLYVSLRMANPNAEACDIIRDVFMSHGEAGGHDNIAGGSFYVGKASDEKKWIESEQSFVNKVLKRLRIPQGDFHFPFRS